MLRYSHAFIPINEARKKQNPITTTTVRFNYVGKLIPCNINSKINVIAIAAKFPKTTTKKIKFNFTNK